MENQNVNAFENLSVSKALAKFIIPSVVGQLATLILNLTDAFFVGRTGDENQIAAMTITFPLVMFMTCVAMIFGTGGNANVASSLARKDYAMAKRFAVFAFYTSMAVISLISVILLFVQPPFLNLLGADDVSIEYCNGYLLWVLHIPCAAMVGSQVLSQLFVAEGETKIASIGIAGGGIINIILDPIFVLVLKQGIIGAGMATCISNYCTLAFFLAVYFKKRKTTMLSINPKYYMFKNGIARKTLSVGIPAGLSIFLMNCSDFVRNYFFGVYGGQIELAAWGTVQKLSNAFMQIAVGIVQGCRPLVSYNFAAKAYKRTNSLIKGTFIIIGCYAAFCIALVMLVPNLLIGIFLPVEEAAPIAVSYFRIWIPCFLGVCFGELANGIFQAIDKWKVSLAGVFCNRIVIYIPCMVILSRFWEIKGVLFSQTISETVTAIVLLIVYFNVMKKAEKGLQ